MASPAAILEIWVNAQTGTASGKLTKLNTEMKASEAQATRSSNAIGGKLAKGMKLLGIAAAAGAAYGLYKAVDAGAQFEKQIDSLGSVSRASAKQIKRLEQQALDLGESTQYTANQVAEAQTELAKGGLTVAQIYGGALKASLSLAAAGELELAAAAETTVNAMKLFGLHGKDSVQIADMLATAANKTTADVTDFAMALKQGGSVAKLAGLDLNNTVTILEALAESGIKNSDAGTSMKTAMIQLLKPTEKQAKVAEELGIIWTTQNGTIKTAAGISKELRSATEGMTKAERAKTLATLAGTDGVRTLNALYAAGPDKLQKLEQANRKQGTAQQVAAEKMDNLKGDWEQFTGALETAEIKLYRVLKGPLRATTQWLTGAVQSVSNFDFAHATEEVEHFTTKLHEMGDVSFAGLNFNVFDTYWAARKKAAEIYVAYLKALPGVATAVFGAVASAFRWVVGAAEDFAGWIARAYRNVVGFVGSLIPVKVALLAVKLAIAPVVGLAMGLFKAIKILSPIVGAVANNFKSVWVAAMKVAIAIIQVLLKYIGNMGAVVGDVVGLVSNLLRGNWGAAWKNAKQLVVDIWHTIIDLLKGGWTVVKTLFSAGTKAIGQILGNSAGALGKVAGNIGEALKGAFSSAWDKIEGIFKTGANAVIDVINAIIDVINVIPGVPDIGKVGHLGEGSDQFSSRKETKKALHHQHRYSGGAVTKPMAIVGEEAPRHHEWVIATNPAYKKANLGYWAQAGADLGIPGFAVGGLIGKAAGAAGDVIGSVVGKGANFFIDKLPKPSLPEPFAELGPYLIAQVSDYIKGGFDEKKFGSLKPGIGGAKGPKGVGSYRGVPMANWVIEALEYASSKGASPQPTSGYRSHAYNVSQGRYYKSEHEGTQYPYGAVDFGGYTTGYAAKMSVVNATRDFKYPLLAPIGFEDDGHASGTGHFKGGLMNYVRHFAKGGVISASGSSALAGSAMSLSNDILTGKVSYFNGPSSSTASGVSVSHPGLALNLNPGTTEAGWNNPTTQKWMKLAGEGHPVFGRTTITGHTANLPIIDLGPHQSTDRAIDVTEAGVHKLGLDPASFPTDSIGKVAILGDGAVSTGGGKGLTEGQQTAAEGKARKKAREAQLKKLRQAVAEAKTDPAKQSKLWQVAKFWGRNGMFDKDERAKVLDYVQQAASKTKVGDSVGVLQNLAAYAGEHGEITGKDPDSWHSLIDAMNKAQERGQEARKKAVERQKKKKETRRNKKLAKIAERAEMPDFIARLEALRKATDTQDEIAGQLVTLEPEDLGDDYVGQERSAYQGSLNDLRDWRNTVIGGRELATVRIAEFQDQIARIEAMAPQANVKGSGKGTGLASAQALGKNTYDQEKWKLPGLQKAIETTTALRDETLLGELEELSPLALSGIISDIPSTPAAGLFGGRIFDAQNTIRELGLKVGSSGGADDSERVGLLEEQLRQANQRNLVFERQKPIIDAYEASHQFAGVFARGGSIPAGMWGIAGEAGPEPVIGPATVVSNPDAQRVFGGSSKVLVQVFEGDPSATKVFVDEKQVEAVVKKVNRRDGRGAQSIGARRAGRLV